VVDRILASTVARIKAGREHTSEGGAGGGRTYGRPRSKYDQIQEDRKKLPIYVERENLLQMIAENQVIIMVGETGSGKTTQLP